LNELQEFILADVFKMLYTECHILNSIASIYQNMIQLSKNQYSLKYFILLLLYFIFYFILYSSIFWSKI